MNEVRHLVLVRHGQTAWNVARRFQGQADPELDEVGHVQAARVAKALAPRRPALIVTSDLRRARQTAAQLQALSGAALVADAGLREIDLGAWEGLSPEDAASRFPGEYDAWTAGLDIRRGGGETAAEAGARAAAALVAATAGVPDGATVVAVSHGLVIQAAVRELASQGLVAPLEAVPHLANGDWMDCELG